MRFLPTLISCLLVGGCASLPSSKPDPRDPWERFNRASFKVNDALDRAVLRPTARAYVKVMPRVVRTGVSNVFSNLETVTTLVNDALQGKMRAVGQDSARLLLNSTLGLGGLFDPASAAGIEKNDEDFGQTLGAWGVQSGPYLMIPLLGPSTVRDAIGRVPDQFTDPSHYLEDDSTRYTITAVEVIDLRAGLLDLDDDLAQSFDRYAFVRNAWMQRREYKVKDGNVEDPAFDEEAMLNEEPVAKPEPPAQ
jgi:phospholipid-binding lipoprotein MlaA